MLGKGGGRNTGTEWVGNPRPCVAGRAGAGDGGETARGARNPGTYGAGGALGWPGSGASARDIWCCCPRLW